MKGALSGIHPTSGSKDLEYAQEYFSFLLKEYHMDVTLSKEYHLILTLHIKNTIKGFTPDPKT